MTARIAARWNVAPRTVQRWRKAWGAIVEDDAALAARLMESPQCAPGVRHRAGEILTAGLKDAPPASTVAGVRAQGDLLRHHLGYFDGKLQKAQQLLAVMPLGSSAGYKAEVMTYSRMVREFSAAVTANDLAAAKLGLDSGEVLPRAEVERILRAFASRAILGLCRLRDSLAQQLVEIPSADAAADLLEPQLLLAGFVAPIADASKLAAAIGLPAWVGDTLAAAVSDYIAEGAAHLAAARASDAAPPPA